jgi:hypothetical protein
MRRSITVGSGRKFNSGSIGRFLGSGCVMRFVGRTATDEERLRYEELFVVRLVPKHQRDQVRASFRHRVRPRQKYRDAWSGLVSHLPCVESDRMTRVSSAELQISEGRLCWDARHDPGSGFDSAVAAVARAFWRSAGVGARACTAR